MKESLETGQKSPVTYPKSGFDLQVPDELVVKSQESNEKSEVGIDPKQIPTISGRPNIAYNGPVGAVLIVGGGISGMQSALDLADSGFLVYLVDKSPNFLFGGMDVV